jgi:superfamily II DNA/RNA helicase
MKNIKQFEAGLAKMGIKELNSLQNETLNSSKTTESTVLYAPTGSGKTLAFALDALLQIDEKNDDLQQLFISPTRELAQQIYEVVKNLNPELNVVLVYGGHSIQTEINRLNSNPKIVIGTPGRIVDLIEREVLDLKQVKHLVFDEFDKVLEMGFLNDIEKIVTKCEEKNSFFLASATELNELPPFLSEFEIIQLDFRDESLKPKFSFFQIQYEEANKAKLLMELLCNIETDKTIIFCNHREKAEELSNFLNDHSVLNSLYHGGLEQADRERALIKFKNGSAFFLICTDLGARGIDIDDVKYIIHYQLPRLENEFVHRNGRSSRQNSNGVVFLFANKLIDWLAQIPVESFDIVENEPLPDEPNYKTIYISAGKKEKLNKVDIVGFLHKIGGIKGENIGMINVFDQYSLVALHESVFEETLKLIKDEKIKGKRRKIGFAK